MFRVVFYLLLAVLLITLLRSVIGIVMRMLAGLLSGANTAGTASTGSRMETPLGGELKKDPVCGTYVAATTGFRRQLGNETFYYCSDKCREAHEISV